ncbi:GGDEF domain-containing protein [Amycolatopsis anabasis]|uniref:GGDEF domain-containing protein n=1 Tax=Amycolatopsis anabasis TaxID=1840409 RepID=UPI00131B8C26|nr:GGDEF domain-containing protein [Amycolatopsis anabasis]
MCGLNWFRRPGAWVLAWELWGLPGRAIAWMVAVEVVSLGAIAATAVTRPVGTDDWRTFGLLALCAVVHIELTRRIEHRREHHAEIGPFLDLRSVWNFAALLVLPPVLAGAMVVFTYGYWLRVGRRRGPGAPHRLLYSCCTVLLANQVAIVVLLAGSAVYPGVPVNVLGLAVVAAAGALRWLAGYFLIVVATMLVAPATRLRDVLGSHGEQVLEVGAMGLGLLAAGVVHQPVLLVGVVLALFALHRSVLLGQFEKAAQTDGKTSLYNAGWWTRLAENSLERTQRRRGGFGLLMLDVDFFKRVNDTHGHPAGDQLLRAIADALRGGVREVDIVGRFGGEEFVVALPEVTIEELAAVSERLRTRVKGLTVPVTSALPEVTELTGVTVSIGAALHPVTGATVEELLLAADAALLTAKNKGRDRVELAPGLYSGGLPAQRSAPN